MSAKTCIVLGASGLIGGNLINLLKETSSYSKVLTFGRKKIFELNSNEKYEEHIVDFSKSETYSEEFKADTVFCCLGTTLRQAGSRQAARYVDVELVIQLAKIAKSNDVKQFLVISSLGADAKSSNFYLKNKGDLEQSLISLNFSQLYILRPSLLLGDRKETRLGEKVGEFALKIFDFALMGSWEKYKGIQAIDVAQAMINISNSEPKKTIFESNEVQHWSKLTNSKS